MLSLHFLQLGITFVTELLEISNARSGVFGKDIFKLISLWELSVLIEFLRFPSEKSSKTFGVVALGFKITF